MRISTSTAILAAVLSLSLAAPVFAQDNSGGTSPGATGGAPTGGNGMNNGSGNSMNSGSGMNNGMSNGSAGHEQEQYG